MSISKSAALVMFSMFSRVCLIMRGTVDSEGRRNASVSRRERERRWGGGGSREALGRRNNISVRRGLIMSGRQREGVSAVPNMRWCEQSV